MLVFGEGGCGKSAVVKDALICREDLILCAFMATDFNVSSMVDVSFRFGTRSMEEFCAAFAEHNKKICVIESAENIINAKNTSIRYN